MKSKKSFIFDRSLISPFVGIAFLAVSITGILLFFHVKNYSIILIHEWLGWAFVAGGIVHLLINYRSMLSYMKSIGGALSAATAVLLLIILSILGMSGGDRHHHHHEKNQFHGK